MLYGFFLLAAALFLGSLALGTRMPPEVSAQMLQEFGKLLEPLARLGPVGVFLVIFLNNAVKALGALVSGIFFGLPPFLFIAFNGFTLGVMVSGLKPIAGYGVIVASVAPHGVVEMPILILATALGFTVGWESLKWSAGRRSTVRLHLQRGLKVYLKWILPGLAVAAAIEAFITPLIVRLAGG